MITRISSRGPSANEAVAVVLGRAARTGEGLTDTVVAHWPGLDPHSLSDEERTWTTAQWAEHLHDLNWQHPLAFSTPGERPDFWHASVRLHPEDRDLTRPEWAEIAHRIARTAGLQRPGDDHRCRWIALQSQHGRLDLIANLIRSDGTRAKQPFQLHKALGAESRRIESELGLISPRTGPDPQQPVQQARFLGRRVGDASAADAASQFAVLLRRLAEERTGPLATVRGLIEHTAHRLEELPDAHSRDSAHQLEMIARRLYGIQQSLDSLAAALPSAARPSLAGPAAPVPTPAVAPGQPGARFAR